MPSSATAARTALLLLGLGACGPGDRPPAPADTAAAAAADTTSVRLALDDGTTLVLRDQLDEESWLRHADDGDLPGTRFRGVRLSLFEGTSYLLVHRGAGRQTRVDARPVPSPAGSRLAVASSDLVAGHDPTSLTILRVEGDTLVPEFRLEPERWGPSDPAWIGEDTLAFTQQWVVDEEPGRTDPRPARVVRSGMSWTLVETAP